MSNHQTILGTSLSVAIIGVALWLYNHEITDFELREATIESLHNALFSGKVTCAQIVDEYIERVNKYDHQIHSVHLINPHARSRSLELDQLNKAQKVG